MTDKRVPLYERLPEAHRLRDEEQSPAGQLKAYLGLVEDAFGAVHENIESLYHDLFIETCDDWVVPYIGDLLGTSHLSGEAWTLRADVADTIALRRRKGTLGAIELLAFDLTRWGVHCVELRENLAWQQHLNHQRPDRGGAPAYGFPPAAPAPPVPPPYRHLPVRGGTVALRDPALLSLLGTPFDPFAYTADFRPPSPGGAVRYNLPNLAIYLWRLAAYRVPVSKPVSRGVQPAVPTALPHANFIARFDTDPLGRPVRLFNTSRAGLGRVGGASPAPLTSADHTPGPIHPARVTGGTPAGNPDAYVAVETYDATLPALPTLDVLDRALQLHLPDATFLGNVWTFRGANLCAWELGLLPPLRNREIAIDPVIGRLAVGVATAAEGAALTGDLLLTYAYGATGPVGAHPVTRDFPPAELAEAPAVAAHRPVNFRQNPNALRDALAGVANSPVPVVIDIEDSMTHDLDLAALPAADVLVEAGGTNLLLGHTLVIRAADGNRPVIRLARPLRFRPTKVSDPNPLVQRQLDAVIDRLTVRLEGVWLTRGPGFPAGEPLVARAAVNRLELFGCTLDPGGFRQLNGMRAPVLTSVALAHPYGFAAAADETAFKQTPELDLQRSVTGPLLIDNAYRLFVTESIVDGGRGVADAPGNGFCVVGATDPINGYGPPTQVNGATFFGRTRVLSVAGRGGIFVHALEALNNQKGCVKFSYFSGVGDRLPQNHACVRGAGVADPADLHFTAEAFGDPAYGQLARDADYRIREQGPDADAMGAFGFLNEAHKWRNLQIRFREFMPVGVRPVLVPAT